MRYLVLLTILSILGIGNVQAQQSDAWYKEKWESVDKFKKSAAPKSALKSVISIKEKSIKEGAEFQLLRALDYLATPQNSVDWHENYPMMDSLISHKHSFSTPQNIALYNLVVAKQLRNYYSIRPYSSGISQDFRLHSVEQWSRQEMAIAIDEYLLKAVNEGESLKNIEVGEYSKLVVVEKDKNQISPLQKLEILPIQKSEADALDLVAPNLYVYTLQSALNLMMGDKGEVTDKLLSASEDYPAIYITTYVSDERKNKDQEMLIKDLDLFIKRYSSDPAVVIAASARLYAMASTSEKVEDCYYQNISDECDMWISKYPKSQYITSIKDLRKALHNPSCSVVLERQYYPKSDVDIEIKYTNVKELKIEIYAINNPQTTKSIPSSLKTEDLSKYTSGAPLFSRNIKFDAPLNISRDMTTTISIPTYGRYLFVCRDKDDTILSNREFAVSRIGAIYRSLDGNQQIYVADFKSGKPYSQITVSAKSSRKEENMTDEVKLDKFTTFFKDYEGGHNFDIQPQNGEDIYSAPTSIYFSANNNAKSSTKEDNKIALYTDRSHYRVGDTIRFHAYIHSVNEDPKLISECKRSFDLLSPSRVKVASSQNLKSDEWGGFAGSFIVSDQWVGGRYQIISESISTYGNNYVYITEFKEPTFNVDFKTAKDNYIIGDEVQINGHVTSLGGYSAQGTKVRYSIGVGRFYWSTSKEILNGEVACDTNGDFSFKFNTESNEERGNMYTIKVNATDKRGETHEFVQRFAFDKFRYDLSVNLPSIITKEQNLQSKVSVNSKDTVKGTYTIMRDSVVITSGEYTTDLPINIDWNTLQSGEYTMVCMADEAAKLNQNFTLFSTSDRETPNSEELFIHQLNEVCSADTPMKFMLGTAEKRVYTLIEIYSSNKDILYSNVLKINKGMKEFNLPYLASYPDKVKINFTTIYQGKVHKETLSFERKREHKELKMKFISLRNQSEPGAKEQFSILVSDEKGEAQRANITLTAYNKASDISNSHEYTSLKTEPYTFFSLYNRSSAAFNSGWMRVYNGSDVRGLKPIVYYNSIPTSSMRHVGSADASNVVVTGFGKATKSNFTGSYTEFTEEKIDDPIEKNNNERLDFRLTAAFINNLTTNSEGIAEVNFDYPDALATYRILAMAVTADASSVVETAEVIVTKDVMVTATLPRFIRSEDKVEVQSQLFNKSSESIEVTFTAKSSNGIISDYSPRSITLLPSSSQVVSFTLQARDDVEDIDLTLSLDSEMYQDIEVHSIPVIASDGVQTTTRSYIVEECNDQKVEAIRRGSLKDLVGANSKDLTVTVYDPEKALLASIPSTMQNGSRSIITTINNWCSTGVGAVSVNHKRDVIEQWIEQGSIDEGYIFNSKNIKESSLPWRYKSNDEAIAKLQLLINKDSVSKVQQSYLNKITSMQNSDGGYPWYPGMPSSPATTLLFLEAYNTLVGVNYYDGIDSDNRAIVEAVKYLDRYAESKLKIENQSKVLSSEIINYLYIRSMFLKDISIDAKYKMSWNFYVGRVKNEWKRYSLIDRVLIASTLNSVGKDTSDIVASIKQYAVKDKSNGAISFPNAVMPYRGLYYRELDAHVKILKLFNALPSVDQALIDGITKWVVLQRKSQEWKSSISTSQAVGLLLGCEDNALQHSLNYKIVDVEHSCIKPLIDMQAQGSDFEVERRIYRIEGEKLILTDPNSMLSVGDRVIVRYFIKSNVNSSFVQIKAARTGALQPTNNMSGYSKGYYRDVRRDETVYSLYTLPEGETIIEDSFHVWHAGQFNDGFVTVRSVFNPSSQANSSTQTININELN